MISETEESNSRLLRSEDGKWSLPHDWKESGENFGGHPSFWETLPRYLTVFDTLFSSAQRKSEFEFLLSLFRVRGLRDAGWDPYETTIQCISSVLDAHHGIADHAASPHLALWIYGHIVEASEPYELIANLIDVSKGGRYSICRFPPKKNGAPMSPGEKIGSISKSVAGSSLDNVGVILGEIWDRKLRNAIFHSDYCIYGKELRISSPPMKYTSDEKMLIINRAIARHESLKAIHEFYIGRYNKPVIIDTHPEFQGSRKAMVIVRESHGAVGLKTVWTKEQERRGEIPVRIGRFSREECKLMDSDCTICLLPLDDGMQSK